VRAADVRLLRETWAIDVDLSRHRAELLHRGRPYRAFAVAVGTPAYPTPRGTFGVTDRLRTGGPGSPYGCCVLALSGRQPHVAQDWPGGDRIAIHGTDEPASIGTAASHGCLRASETTMHLLMARVPLGTPVTIHT
jgi:lipoprotein-anchoring transpeptidase ErfK/SrfK